VGEKVARSFSASLLAHSVSTGSAPIPPWKLPGKSHLSQFNSPTDGPEFPPNLGLRRPITFRSNPNRFEHKCWAEVSSSASGPCFCRVSRQLPTARNIPIANVHTGRAPYIFGCARTNLGRATGRDSVTAVLKGIPARGGVKLRPSSVELQRVTASERGRNNFKVLRAFT